MKCRICFGKHRAHGLCRRHLGQKERGTLIDPKPFVQWTDQRRILQLGRAQMWQRRILHLPDWLEIIDRRDKARLISQRHARKVRG